MRTRNLFEHMSYMAELNAMYQKAAAGFDRRIVLRQYYMDAMPEIISLAQQSLTTWADIYPFDWKFNANERSLWSSIRHRPMVLYPEFPVLNRFVDFGNPFLGIAIEADSKQFHDRSADIKRDETFLRIGWKTFRVTYEENMKEFTELSGIAELQADEFDGEAMEKLEDWMLNTSDGVVDAIQFFYFMTDEARAGRMTRFPGYYGLAEDTLKKHRHVDFELPDIRKAQQSPPPDGSPAAGSPSGEA
jgi:very-short-patch-repair endonuclease